MHTRPANHPSMASFHHLFHSHYHHCKDNGTNGLSGFLLLFRMVGGSLALWLLGLSSVLLLVAMYSRNPFAVHPITMIGQSDPPKEEIIYSKEGKAEVDEEEEYCDLTEGAWVRSSERPPYTNQSCGTIPESKNCGKYGKDMDYVRWRWKPHGCTLPRFDAKRFLAIVRGKTMGFIGDSVARNQYESLLCLLSQEEIPVDVYHEPDDRFRTWHFPTHNFTLKALWTRFFVQATELLSNGSSTGVFNLHVDRIDPTWSQHLHNIDFAILSNGHWFFRKLYIYDDGHLLGCVFCSEPNVSTISIASAIGKALQATLHFVNGCRECKSGLFTLLRTFSPAHFENGSWDTGGYCNRTRPTQGEESDGGTVETHLGISEAQVEEVERAKELEGKKRFEAVQVTRMMMARGDGHPGKHWNNEWMKGYSDCVHWCLPGPVDVWNELLLEILSRRRNM